MPFFYSQLIYLFLFLLASDPPILSQTDFSSLSLRQPLLENLTSLGFTSMTPVQAQSLPHILAGKDVIAQAKTGSGKTAAFGLGLLNKLDVSQRRLQALVLCPTRELADQVAKQLRQLARTTPNVKVLTICGGMPFGPQISSLKHGAHIVVGTPGRVEDHLGKANLVLEQLSTLVLDEADRMLDMGFEESLEAILAQMPTKRQTLMFSATFPDAIRHISEQLMVKPARVKVSDGDDEQLIEQHFYRVDQHEGRLVALRLLLLKHRPTGALVFCNTKRETDEVAAELSAAGFSALALHGDLEQRDRDQTLVRFSNQSASVLVATDVAARGLDIERLDLVVNYQIASDVEVHVHRIGRTGRAGNRGIACTLYVNRESHRVDAVSEYLQQEIQPETLPGDDLLDQSPQVAPMVTLQIEGGKKRKLRPGDILGALTGSDGVAGDDVGKISIFDNSAYVAVRYQAAKSALRKLSEGELKGRKFRVRRLR